MNEANTLLKPDELQPSAELARLTLEQLDRILLGRTELHRLVLIAFSAKATCCWKACPASAKPPWSETIGQILQLDFKRIQFTPDLMRETSSAPTFCSRPTPASARWCSRPARCSPTYCSPTKSIARRPRRNPLCWRPCRKLGHTAGHDPDFAAALLRIGEPEPDRAGGNVSVAEAQLDRFLFRCCSTVWTPMCWTGSFRAAAGRVAAADVADGSRPARIPVPDDVPNLSATPGFPATLPGWFRPRTRAARRQPNRLTATSLTAPRHGRRSPSPKRPGPRARRRPADGGF